MRIVHDDDDIVVVDKPVGVAAHPQRRLDRPDRGRRPGRGRLPDLHLGRGRAAGHRAAGSTSAPSGLMVVAKSEHAYTVLKQAFRDAHGRQDLSRARPGPARPVHRHHRRADRPAPGPRLQVRGHAPAASSVTHYERSRRSGRDPARDPPGDRPHAPDPGALRGAAPPAACGDLDLRRRPALAERLGLDRQWLHAMRLGFEHPGTGEWVTLRQRLPGRPEHALDSSPGLRASPADRRGAPEGIPPGDDRAGTNRRRHRARDRGDLGVLSAPPSDPRAA